jgi:hypothetical protein
MARDKVEKGLLLLSALKSRELTLKEVTEILEAVTKVPGLIREILIEGERRGLIKRRRGRVSLCSLEELTFERRIKKYKCLSRCSRCGRRITSCYFVLLGDEEFGPFGCECVKKLRLY